MIKSLIALATIALTASSLVSAQMMPNHISFTQPVGDGITYVAGSTQTFSWSMACTTPSTLISATPNATEVDFMDSNNINNAFYVKKVGTIDCTKSVGNLVWTVPADTKPGVYALQLLLTPNNAYSGRFNVTAPGGSPSTGTGSGGAGAGSGSSSGDGTNSGSDGQTKHSAALTLSAGKSLALAAGGAVLAMFV